MTSIRFLALIGAVAAAVTFTQPADAGGSWGGSWGGSSGGSWGGSSGGSWGGSSGGSYGGYSHGGSWGGSHGHVGPIRRLFARIHAHKAARHSRGSSGGYAVSYGGSSGGSWGGGSSGGSSGGSYGGSSGGYAAYATSAYATAGYASSAPVVSSVQLGATAPYESAPVAPTYSAGDTVIDGSPVIGSPTFAQPIDSSAVPSAGTMPSDTILNSTSADVTAPTDYQAAKPAIESDAAMLMVAVPEDATVTVNDHPTTSEGSVRQFLSQGLKEGYVYTYVVKVSYDDNGQNKTESKEVKLRAGESKELSFESAAHETSATDENSASESAETAAAADSDAEALITVVRLHVPEGAKVTLAGNPTNGQGVVRTFRTKQLKPGQQWKGYAVRVVATVNGQSVTQVRTIDVQAGSTNELTFDFATTDAVASR